MRRATGTEPKGKREEFPLINRLQQHDHRTLEDFVLRGGQSNRPILLLILWHIRALDRRRLVATAFGSREQVPQIFRQMLSIPSDRLPVDSRRSVLANTPVGFVHPVQVQMLIQRRQRLVRMPLRHHLYASSSGGHAFHGHRSHARFRRHFHNPTAAFPTPGLPRAGFPGFNRYYAAAKTASVRLCTFALSLGARYLGSPAVFAADRPRGRRAWFRSLFHRYGPCRLLPRRQEALPASRETLYRSALLSSDPGRTSTSDRNDASVLSTSFLQRRPHRYNPFRGSITRLCSWLPTLEGAISDASQGSLPAAGQALPGGLVPAGFQLRLSFAHSLSLSFRCWLERHPVSSDFCWRQGNWIFRGIFQGDRIWEGLAARSPSCMCRN